MKICMICGEKVKKKSDYCPKCYLDVFKPNILCFSCHHTYPDKSYLKQSQIKNTCPYCGHNFESLKKQEIRLKNTESNNQLFLDLLYVANNLDHPHSIIPILTKWMPSISRACFDKRFSQDIISSMIATSPGFPSTTILYYGFPLGHIFPQDINSDDDCIYEFWLKEDGTIVKNKLTAIWKDWDSELNVEFKEEVNINDELFNKLRSLFTDQWYGPFFFLAQYKLNPSLLSSEEKIKLILEYHFKLWSRSGGYIGSLPEESLDELIRENQRNKLNVSELINAVDKCISDGAFQEFELKIIEGFVEKELALSMLNRALELYKDEIDPDKLYYSGVVFFSDKIKAVIQKKNW